jgi:hypothetical protein
MTTLFPRSQPVPAARHGQIQTVILDACGDTQARGLREPRLRPRLVLSGAGMAAALTGVAVTSWVLVSRGGSQPALAAWTTVPQSVSAAQAAQLTDGCTGWVAGHFPISLGRVASSLAEQRGSSSAVLLAGATGSEAICVNPAPGATAGGTGVEAGPQVGIVAADPMIGSLKVDGGAGGSAVGLTAVFGRVTGQASTVEVTAEDGRVITASVGHGYFLAWWPSGSPVGTVRALDAAGHVIATAAQPTAAATGGLPAPRRSS